MTDLFANDPMPDDWMDKLSDSDIKRRWPRNLVEMLDVITAAHERAGHSKDSARKLATASVRALSEYIGGGMYYMPKGEALENALRDAAIWDAHTGDNVQALARQYRLTEQRIYQILAEQRGLHKKRVQPGLFD